MVFKAVTYLVSKIRVQIRQKKCRLRQHPTAWTKVSHLGSGSVCPGSQVWYLQLAAIHVKFPPLRWTFHPQNGEKNSWNRIISVDPSFIHWRSIIYSPKLMF